MLVILGIAVSIFLALFVLGILVEAFDRVQRVPQLEQELEELKERDTTEGDTQ